MNTSLAIRSTDISDLYQEVQQHGVSALECAIKAGHLLTEAKGEVGHGGWLNFVEATGMSPRTAQKWMRLAENEEQIRLGGAFDGINQALEYLADPKDEKEEKKDDPDNEKSKPAGERLRPGEYVYAKLPPDDKESDSAMWIWATGDGDSVVLYALAEHSDDPSVLGRTYDFVPERTPSEGIEIRSCDDEMFDLGLLYYAEIFQDNPGMKPALTPELAFKRLSYTDRDVFNNKWRILGQAISEGWKTHTDSSTDYKKLHKNKAFAKWRDENGVGGMDKDAVFNAIFCMDKWQWWIEANMKVAAAKKKREAAS